MVKIKAGPDVVALEFGELAQDLVLTHPRSQVFQYIRYGDPESSWHCHDPSIEGRKATRPYGGEESDR